MYRVDVIFLEMVSFMSANSLSPGEMFCRYAVGSSKSASLIMPF